MPIPIADSELVRRAIASARPREFHSGPRWAAVMEVFALGSTYAAQLCRDHGLDPDEEMKRPFHQTRD